MKFWSSRKISGSKDTARFWAFMRPDWEFRSFYVELVTFLVGDGDGDVLGTSEYCDDGNILPPTRPFRLAPHGQQQEVPAVSSYAPEPHSPNGMASQANGRTTPKSNVNVPSHVRVANGGSNASASSNSLPPHLRSKPTSETKGPITKSPNSRLVTDGPVDTTYKASIPAPMLSPPSSPATIVQQDPSVDKLYLNA
ncbi:hypothetical protein HBI81_246030 [Parastagonospora nodorum]|nr:hypothetical protein HBH52_074120 [Parastagonospora nodorum]KAH5483756.1 hypothetical protein HBI31_174180 [Parastagonospora nodorum]KAH6511055.1 hypothetical protein HBI81_246030 [Parastagonospora nodorum]